jgi:hypothetical protein
VSARSKGSGTEGGDHAVKGPAPGDSNPPCARVSCAFMHDPPAPRTHTPRLLLSLLTPQIPIPPPASPRLFYGYLPHEGLAGEVLTPFLRSLPCSHRRGLASLLAHLPSVLAADYQAISLHFTRDCGCGPGGARDCHRGDEVTGLGQQYITAARPGTVSSFLLWDRPDRRRPIIVRPLWP